MIVTVQATVEYVGGKSIDIEISEDMLSSNAEAINRKIAQIAETVVRKAQAAVIA